MRLSCVLGLVLVSLLLGAADTSNNKGKIEGTKWSSMAATIKGESIPADTLQLEFGKDGSLVYKAGPQTFTGTYILGMGDTLTMNLDRELAGRKTHVEKVTITGDQLTMTDSDGTALTFAKAK